MTRKPLSPIRLKTSQMSNEENDPLEDLYGDKESFDRERLANALKGVIEIDRDTGGPIFKERYYELTNKEKFIAQLLYRRVAVALGEIEENEVGISSGYAASNTDVGESAIRNYAVDLDFVESDEELGGYYLSPYAVGQGTRFIESDDN